MIGAHSHPHKLPISSHERINSSRMCQVVERANDAASCSTSLFVNTRGYRFSSIIGDGVITRLRGRPTRRIKLTTTEVN